LCCGKRKHEKERGPLKRKVLELNERGGKPKEAVVNSRNENIPPRKTCWTDQSFK